MRRFVRLAGAGVMLGSLLLGSLVPAASAADEARTLRMGLASGITSIPASINPFMEGGWYPAIVTYEQLTGRGLDFGSIPQFAESWAVSEDGKTWTFTIPAGKLWSDGEPATARDVVFTYEYMRSTIGTPNEFGLGVNHVTPEWSTLESISATDDQTVVMTLTRASTWPLESQVYIVPQHIWKDVTPEAAITTFESPTPMVGSGPFVTTEFDPEQFVRMERNANYFGTAPQIDEWLISGFDSVDAAVTALKRGEIDCVDNLSGTAVRSLEGEPGIVAEGSASPWYLYLTFNTMGTANGGSTDALSDPAFRDALGYAMDNSVIADKAAAGGATAGLSIFTPLMGSYYEATKAAIGADARTFDLDGARARLEAAGYVDSDGDGIREDKAGQPLALRLFVHTVLPLFAPAAQFVKDWFAQVGVEVTTTTIEVGAMVDRLAAPEDGGGDWDLAMIGTWPEPFASNVTHPWTKAAFSAGNHALWTNDEYEALYQQLLGTVDEAERVSIASQMAAIHYREAPVLVMVDMNVSIAYRTDRFTGWTKQPAEIGRSIDTYYPEQTWMNLQPVGAATAAPTTETPTGEATASAAPSASSAPAEPSSGGSDSTGPIAVVAILAIAAIGGFLLRRRRAA